MNPQIDDRSRLQLQNMMAESNYDDVETTNLIRQLKHSVILRKDIAALVALCEKYRDSPEELLIEGMNECEFLHTYYTQIFTRIRKNEIDLGMLNDFLDVLQRIEDGELSQTDGAVLVGTTLKKMYIDSALKASDKLPNMSTPVAPIQFKCMNWKAYKSISKSGTK